MPGKRFIFYLQPRFQRGHTVLVPRKRFLRHVCGDLIAVYGVYRRMQDVFLLIAGKTLPKISDGPGVDIGPLEPMRRQFFKLRMHGYFSL